MPQRERELAEEVEHLLPICITTTSCEVMLGHLDLEKINEEGKN